MCPSPNLAFQRGHQREAAEVASAVEVVGTAAAEEEVKSQVTLFFFNNL